MLYIYNFIFVIVSCLIRNTVEYLCNQGQARSILRPLRRLFPMMCYPENCLIPSHADYLQGCISGQMYKVGYEFVMSNPVLEIDLKLTGITPKDFLRYFYYAGICCTGMRNYTAAFENFTQAYSLNGHSSISSISVSAYKKAALLSLILKGKKIQPPLYATATLGKLEKYSKEYDAISVCYAKNDPILLRKFLSENEKLFIEDDNLGLAKKLIESSLRQRMKEISRTYVTLSIPDIVSQLQVIINSFTMILHIFNCHMLYQAFECCRGRKVVTPPSS